MRESPKKKKVYRRKCKGCKTHYETTCAIKKYCQPRCRESYTGEGYLKMRFYILTRDGFKCKYCGRSPATDQVILQVDHVVPRKLGGDENENNLVTACRDCNYGKKDTLLNLKEHQYEI
jgi:5-methylcytosine-specific restriction endonuclease McrA